MDYIPHTPEDTAAMLSTIGVESVDELLRSIPENLRLKRRLNLPPALSEPEVLRKMADLRASIRTQDQLTSFLGGGCYRHFIPAVVEQLSSRNEFATAYTPYQAEASQGNLQAIFEYQTMICELTGMDVSNASHYDGSTAAAEAVLMAMAQTGRKRVLLSRGLHPEYREVIATYLRNIDAVIEELPLREGTTQLPADPAKSFGDAAVVFLQHPNYLGCLEDVEQWAPPARAAGAIVAVSANPIALALLKPPGESGADIAIGEGQPLGADPSFGGPGFGFIAAKEFLLRKVPGRIVGQTKDDKGRRGFVLTLQTREQHIRREKSSSNICTNQALMALRGAIYMAAAGRKGLREVAEQCVQKSHFLAERLAGIPGIRRKFTTPFFHEFVVECSKPTKEINARLLAGGILGGIPLDCHYPKMERCMLICATELTRREEMDRFVETLSSIMKD